MADKRWLTTPTISDTYCGKYQSYQYISLSLYEQEYGPPPDAVAIATNYQSEEGQCSDDDFDLL